MKYLQSSFSVPVSNGSYEEIFVCCHCSCHEPGFPDVPCWNIRVATPCCRPCAWCGAKVRIGMEKRHECKPVAG